MPPVRRRSTVAAILTQSILLFAGAAAVEAQEKRPISLFVVDVRGALASFGQSVELAQQRDLLPLQFPALGLGVDLGAHVYPVRWGALTFGVGAQMLVSRAARSPLLLDPDPGAPPVGISFNSISPQLSFNFGGTNGWSYISGGIGKAKFSVDARRQGDTQENTDVHTMSVLNYGGGGRWFAKEHLAFSFDLRFYAISPQAEVDGQPGLPRMSLMVFSLGASFR